MEESERRQTKQQNFKEEKASQAKQIHKKGLNCKKKTTSLVNNAHTHTHTSVNGRREDLALTCFSPSCKWFTSCDMWHLSE